MPYSGRIERIERPLPFTDGMLAHLSRDELAALVGDSDGAAPGDADAGDEDFPSGIARAAEVGPVVLHEACIDSPRGGTAHACMVRCGAVRCGAVRCGACVLACVW